MSDQDKAALIGRFFLERNNAMEEKVALDAELRDLTSALNHLDSEIKYRSPDEVAARLKPVAQFMNVEAIVAFMKRRAQLDRDVIDRTEDLRKLGVNPQ